MSDLISRQNAIDALEEQLDYLHKLNKDENPTAESKWYGINWARNTIADMPSAEPQRKKGKWIRGDQDKLLGRAFCSVCNKWEYQASNFNFCPNCGARMVRGEEDA